MADAGYVTIGKVVKRLQGEYPDLSVSKVRYLEDEGLLTPSRTTGGYRLYSQHDIRRLESILYLQKNRFMPLQVIREELDKYDAAEPSMLDALNRRKATSDNQIVNNSTAAQSIAAVDSQEVVDKYHPINRIPELIGVSVSFVRQLSEAGVISMRRSPRGRDLVDGRDFALIRACSELSRYGIQPKNLRWYVQAANRESGMFEQALVSFGARRGAGAQTETPEQREQFEVALTNMLALTNAVRDTLIRRRLKGTSEDQSH
ncbi:MAG: MerR family transcriptional regulator [Atopobiaceae bacterium]|jgi:DNA-binding transcriptional MerR regulator